MTIRARLVDVKAALAGLLRDDALAAAAGNALVSRTEQEKAPAHVSAAADAVRTAGGPGVRVSVEALSAALVAQADAFIANVNQPAGSGAGFLSKREVEGIIAQNAALGGRVQRAYEIALRGSVDVDAIARARVPTAPDELFMMFSAEAEAENFRDPQQRTVRWLVVTGETAATKSYVIGFNDLWAERFDINKADGAITVTGEH